MKLGQKGVLDIVDLMDKLQKITDIGKSAKDKQRIINVSEVFYIWDILVTKLDILETIQLYENFIEDYDLKVIKDGVKNGITTGITDMEKLMDSYALPFPERPPAGIKTTVDLEQLTDRYIYQGLFEAIQAFFYILASGFMNSYTPDIRKAIKNHLLLTIELQETLVDYGKLKGFLNEPPIYRP